VRALIAGTESIYKWALFERPPLATWTRGRVTLLGDAAHPMLPFLGQGASQSLEDALVLARCLAADRDDPLRALEAYAGRRRERTAALQTASRDQGRLVQQSDLAAVGALLRRAGATAVHATHDRAEAAALGQADRPMTANRGSPPGRRGRQSRATISAQQPASRR
jgi:2-polyprenyl-6-methoxyphenol hydroxylase-like FAD-dependent oxidoreductase